MEESHDVVVVLERVVRAVRRLATAGELGATGAAVLVRLVREGPQRLTALAQGESVSQPGMTQLVQRLERDGLVRRTRCEDDGRVVLVEVTALGEQLVARRREERAEALSALLDRLGAPDRAAVLSALPALSRLAELALSPGGPS